LTYLFQGRCLQMGRAKNTNGVVRGRLIGGNLTVYTSLLGTQWQDDAERCILLLEDGALSFTSSYRLFFELYMK
jgi:muramoyltetrapeptide carboxypeptidase